MKNIILLLASFFITPLLCSANWVWMGSFPYVWDNERASWSYYQCSNNELWAYSFDLDTWSKVGDPIVSAPDFASPENVQALKCLSENNEISVIIPQNDTYLNVFETPHTGSSELITYTYNKTGEKTGYLTTVNGQNEFYATYTDVGEGTFTANFLGSPNSGVFQELDVVSSEYVGKRLVLDYDDSTLASSIVDFVNKYQATNYGFDNPNDVYDYVYCALENKIVFNSDFYEVIEVELDSQTMLFTGTVTDMQTGATRTERGTYYLQ